VPTRALCPLDGAAGSIRLKFHALTSDVAHRILAEVGPAAYINYQIMDDSGTAARNPGVHDHGNAAGIQEGVTWPK
jgi:hypothetical protein